MIEKSRQSLDKGGYFEELLTDLCKAFDCLFHDLLITKLHVYGFDIPALRLLQNYLTNRKQRVKIGRKFSFLGTDIIWSTTRFNFRGRSNLIFFYVIYFFS